MPNDIVEFTYMFLGIAYDVRAEFEIGKFEASPDGPYDADPTLFDIEVIGPDGGCWASEMNTMYACRFSKLEAGSVLDLIKEEAFDRCEY